MNEEQSEVSKIFGERWSRRRVLRIGAGLAALPVFGGLLAACGDDDVPPSDTSTTTTGTGSTATPAAVTPDATSMGETIKVGILHSFSGTMAVSEVSVADA
ncbi:MAG: hypothetical protein WD942_02015, partial [Dehalococcoidia bacterium]